MALGYRASPPPRIHVPSGAACFRILENQIQRPTVLPEICHSTITTPSSFSRLILAKV